MSFFKVLGTIGKTVAKVGLGVVGGVTGVDINGAVFGSTSAAPASVTSAPSVATPNPVVTPNSSNNILDAVKGLFNAGTSFLTGQTHAQVDVNTGVGGRQGDTTQSTGLPSWLLPAALAGGGILLVSSLSKSKSRY